MLHVHMQQPYLTNATTCTNLEDVRRETTPERATGVSHTQTVCAQRKLEGKAGGGVGVGGDAHQV